MLRTIAPDTSRPQHTLGCVGEGRGYTQALCLAISHTYYKLYRNEMLYPGWKESRSREARLPLRSHCSGDTAFSPGCSSSSSASPVSLRNGLSATKNSPVEQRNHDNYLYAPIRASATTNTHAPGLWVIGHRRRNGRGQ